MKKELLQMGVMPSQVDGEDLVDLLEVLEAKPKEERVQATDEAFDNMAKLLGN